ncbi:MAG: hypothetical protein IPK06_00815 [Ignavibacteriae bacterium]|nr:hypothetical protein [Ignavibacteriota bacterium]
MKKLTILLFFFTVFIGKSLAQVELLSNGTFDADNSWQKSNAGATILNGQVTLDALVWSNPYIFQNLIEGSQTGKSLILSYKVIEDNIGSDKFVIYGVNGFQTSIVNSYVELDHCWNA